MIFLSIHDIIEFQGKTIDKHGGEHGVRDITLLQSAVASALATFDGEDLFPTMIEKAARLGYGIVSYHPFIDGNKRIGVWVMLATLRLNNIIITYTKDELVSFGLGIASGSLQYEDILDWIKFHLSN
ncbi:MAG: type II toxin-antitoxin system death-on-curing family toxin [bacterium]